MKKFRHWLFGGIFLSLLLIGFAILSGGFNTNQKQALGAADVSKPIVSSTLEAPIPSSPQSDAISMPQMAPVSDEGYSPEKIDQLITRSDGQRIAKLSKIPSGITEVAAKLPNEAVDDTRIGFSIIGSIRYQGQDAQIYVTTSVISKKGQSQPFFLGSQSVTLASGKTVSYDANLPGPLSTEFRFQEGNIFISVASNLSVDKIRNIMSDIVIN